MDSPKSWEHSLMRRPNKKQDLFREHINEKFALSLKNYHDLYKWSIDEYATFWNEFLEFSKILVSEKPTKIVDDIPMDEIPRWFHGCKLNYTENLLQRRDDKVALYIIDERLQQPKTVTFSKLFSEVSRYATALRSLGVTIGDRVCGYVSNNEHSIYAYLATAALGAIWSSTSPDLGHKAVIERFSQIKPKIVFAVNKQIYNGRLHDKMASIAQISQSIQAEKIIILPFDDSEELVDISAIGNSVHLENFLENGEAESFQFEQVPFSHPLCILFSSGTTGRPKCMVHSVGGTLIQHRKEHELLGDLNANDVFFYYTTTGWMMWNWLVSGLAAGASLVLFEGCPILPKSPLILFDMADRLGVTVFGTSAKYLAALEERLGSGSPGKLYNLEKLHTILSTGSTLMPHSFDYVHNHIKSDVMLGSISGGSDIISCFVGQNCTLPVTRAEVQSRNLGMDIQSVNADGEAVFNKQGELVCCTPFPSMPVFFWSEDPEVGRQLYEKAYFSKYPHVWHHGDYCQINSDSGGVIMLGRSDATLNPSGVRFGSIEIYNVVETIAAVKDSVCVSYISKKTSEEKVALFVVLTASDTQLDDDLRNNVKIAIRNSLSARHVPSIVLQVPDIPYTLNGKKVEVAVKRIINGEDFVDTTTLSNPECIQEFQSLRKTLEVLD